MIGWNIKKANLNRIKSWISKSNWNINEFDKFIAMFISCNIFYSLYAKTKDDNANLYADKTNCLAIKELLNITPANMKLIKKFYRCLSAEFSLENRTGEDLINKLNDRIFSFENNREEEMPLLDTVLECLYTIRCNLLHGGKDVIKQQMELMNYSTPLLKSLLNIALKEYKKLYFTRNRAD